MRLAFLRVASSLLPPDSPRMLHPAQLRFMHQRLQHLLPWFRRSFRLHRQHAFLIIVLSGTPLNWSVHILRSAKKRAVLVRGPIMFGKGALASSELQFGQRGTRLFATAARSCFFQRLAALLALH